MGCGDYLRAWRCQGYPAERAHIGTWPSHCASVLVRIIDDGRPQEPESSWVGAVAYIVKAESSVIPSGAPARAIARRVEVISEAPSRSPRRSACVALGRAAADGGARSQRSSAPRCPILDGVGYQR
jgi:hypothetical protein